MAGVVLGSFLLCWSALWIPLALAVNLLCCDQELLLRLARHRWAAGIVRVFATRVEVRGADKIDPEATYLFVANHLSHLDVPVLMHAIPFGVRFLAKQQLRKVPLLGRFIEASGMVFIERSNPRRARQSLVRMSAKLRSGQSFVAFPEGSRSRTGELGAFRLGAFRAAIEAGVPIVPVAIRGTGAIWPADSRPWLRGPVQISFGRPRLIQGMSVPEAARLTVELRQAVDRLSMAGG